MPNFLMTAAPMTASPRISLLVAVASILPVHEAALVLLQTGASIQKVSRKVAPAPAGDYRTPRLFVTQGCDGSTAILQHAYRILDLHGVSAGDDKMQKELLDPPRNPFINDQNQDIFVAMQQLIEQRRKWGTALVFKGINGRDEEVFLDKRMVDMGVLAVLNSRRNMLDQVVCMVRDCFVDTDWRTTMYGYPVDETGESSDLCFDRRESTDALNGTSDDDYKAYLAPATLVDNIKGAETESHEMITRLRQAGYNATHVFYENLVAFEEDVSEVQTSVKEWKKLLLAWGVDPWHKTITRYLESQSGTRSPQPLHIDVIYNLNAVKETLKEAGMLDLLRE